MKTFNTTRGVKMKYKVTLIPQHNPSWKPDEYAVVAESDWIEDEKGAIKEQKRLQKLLDNNE